MRDLADHSWGLIKLTTLAACVPTCHVMYYEGSGQEVQYTWYRSRVINPSEIDGDGLLT